MTGKRRIWIRLAAASGFIAVAAGAFAAHGADPAAKDLLRTGAQYQAIHALAVLAWAALARDQDAPSAWVPGLFLVGTVLFSGSLYALALGAPHLAGLVTPMGGLMFLGGWGALAWGSGLAVGGLDGHSDA